MRATVLAILLAALFIGHEALAGADQPWRDSSDGFSGTIPDLAIFTGLVAAAWYTWGTWEEDQGFYRLYYTFFFFSLGLIPGMLISLVIG